MYLTVYYASLLSLKTKNVFQGKPKKPPHELIWDMFINEEECDGYDNITFDDPLKKEFHSSFESIKHEK